MSKKALAKNNSKEDALSAADVNAAAAAEAALCSPRTQRKHVWARRADETAVAMQQVQQLLQKHATDTDSARQGFDHVISTATQLWALEAEELPLQYRDKSRPASQRGGSAASARGGNGTDQRSSSKQPQRAAGNVSPRSSTASPVFAAAPATAESVESAIRQLSPAVRPKVSTAMKTLFYAPAAAPAVTPSALSAASSSASSVVHRKEEGRSQTAQQQAAAGESPRPQASATRSSTNLSPPPAAAADGDPVGLNESNRRANSNPSSIIPIPLLAVIKELQGRRIQLEAQLTTASNATAQQLQRLQLLQEEAMVAQYALAALRKDAAQSQTRW
ncbi:hypothetical protein ABB37_02883 [Leptomonas pyrrhocoris]|uniref:Uncharacterized protein n=1 Tax=Leptomonas pyrrhocoris TaxID=157538 RepID=A0A0M9G674_LEPPY|nr:hypothetical protein ABB37_02883 [Leptomonas pyrrhocoris]KPA83197.1 hypothetical protein ABB37_02883 [Leptomonas pyrrhocoris]|eukprot:XP_015661636.1 hypothetical protein ABB37_02883 [Leptomonas pyrrhocoris]